MVAANNALQVVLALAIVLSHLPRAIDGRGSTRPLLITLVIKRIFFVKGMFRCCEKS